MRSVKRRQSARFNGVPLNNSLNIGASQKGVYLTLFAPLAIGAKALLLPWDKLSFHKKTDTGMYARSFPIVMELAPYKDWSCEIPETTFEYLRSSAENLGVPMNQIPSLSESAECDAMNTECEKK